MVGSLSLRPYNHPERGELAWTLRIDQIAADLTKDFVHQITVCSQVRDRGNRLDLRNL